MEDSPFEGVEWGTIIDDQWNANSELDPKIYFKNYLFHIEQ